MYICYRCVYALTDPGTDSEGRFEPKMKTAAQF